MNQPQNLNQVIGNRAAINRIRTEIARWQGLGGCIFMLQGASGNGKTLIADILAGMADGGEPYRPDCTKDAETGIMVDHIKDIAGVPSMFGGLSVFIFDECDRLSPDNIAKLKITLDVIDRRRESGADVSVVVIFTTAKKKEDLTPTQQKHWDELTTRCALCTVGATMDELNEHFAKVTGGACADVALQAKRKIGVLTVRTCKEYIVSMGLPMLDVESDDSEPLIVLPESGRKRAEFFHTSERSYRRGSATKKQQGLVQIVRQIVESAGEPLSVPAIRVELDLTDLYIFKKGVDGYRRTDQIRSAIANHIKTHGESAIIRKTDDGRIAVR